MEFEDVGVVALRVSLLLLTMLFGLPGNIMAMVLKARSFKTQGVNAIAYVHLSFVDLLMCMFHAPIGIVLELCGYFSLKNDIGDDLRTLLFSLNRGVSMRVFAFTSFTSQITLAVIALFRCWKIFHPFGRSRKSIMVTMLAIPDVLTVTFMAFVQKTPAMYFETPTNASETNSTENQLPIQSTWTIDDNTTELYNGKTVTEDHGLLEPLLVYTMLITVILLTICYSLIGYKIHQGYCKLTEGFSETSTQNETQRKILRRQVNHVKTQFILILTLLITALPTIIIAVVGFTTSYAVLRVRATVVALGSGINTYVYCLMTAESRRATIQFFTRRKD